MFHARAYVKIFVGIVDLDFLAVLDQLDFFDGALFTLLVNGEVSLQTHLIDLIVK